MILIINLSTKFSTPQGPKTGIKKRPCVRHKTQGRFLLNASAFYLKRKGVLNETDFCLRISVFTSKIKDTAHMLFVQYMPFSASCSRQQEASGSLFSPDGDTRKRNAYMKYRLSCSLLPGCLGRWLRQGI